MNPVPVIYLILVLPLYLMSPFLSLVWLLFAYFGWMYGGLNLFLNTIEYIDPSYFLPVYMIFFLVGFFRPLVSGSR